MVNMDYGQAKIRIEELRKTLWENSRRYYVDNAPTMSDFEYDHLMRELEDLERLYPDLQSPDSPTQRVGSDLDQGVGANAEPAVRKEFAQYPHKYPMLSLGNTYNIGEIEDFVHRAEKDLGDVRFTYSCELKFDGTAICLTYRNGVLFRALTRGDGVVGDDVTANALRISNIPERLKGSGWPGEFEIRGEVLMPYESFDRLNKEREDLDNEGKLGTGAIRATYEVKNPAIFGRTIGDVTKDNGDRFVISRVLRNDELCVPSSDMLLKEGDKLLIVTSPDAEDLVKILFGDEIDMPFKEWDKPDSKLVAKKITVTKPSITGHSLKDLNVRSIYGVSVTRVFRSGVELVASPNLYLHVGDSLLVVGPEEAMDKVAGLFGNKAASLSHPNLIPIFFGIVVGVIFGSLPIKFPGIPQPIKLGLAGGPLIIAILLGYFGPKLKITTYTTLSANMMIREIGISFFLAAVGLGAGENFISSIVNGGYWWILYGALITLVPVICVILLARLVFKLNFYQICGLVSGGTTNPPVLAFSQEVYGTNYPSISYATVYPLTMFMRVLVAQLMILFTL